MATVTVHSGAVTTIARGPGRITQIAVAPGSGGQLILRDSSMAAGSALSVIELSSGSGAGGDLAPAGPLGFAGTLTGEIQGGGAVTVTTG